MNEKTLKIKSLYLASILVILSFVLVGCVQGETNSNATPTNAPGQTTVPLGVAGLNVYNDPKLGKILVDENGLTLYNFKLDTPGVSNCLSTCGATWPPLMSSSTPIIQSSEVKGKVALITRPDGSSQVTYNGLPLYHFALSNKPGDTSGNGYGGNWSVVAP